MNYITSLAVFNVSATLLLGFSVPVAAQDQSVIHKETYSQLREHCQISSPKYTGKCQYTVISFGRSMNIHFDLDELGHTGLTFISNAPRQDGDGLSIPVIAIWQRFREPSPASAAAGECSISSGLSKIICITSDGLYSATAEGIITR
jgi:hypothetical protein